jgi:putative acetyltransferase
MSVSSDLLIARASLTGADAQALIQRLDAELAERYPDPEEQFFDLAEEDVADGRGVFLLARRGEEPVGCGAVRVLDPATGEIKRMYVAPSARGARIGAALIAELERHARGLGLRRMVLEAGKRQPEALRLYEREGYAPIPCFGQYEGSAASLCMGKTLM